jgi:uncharacterized protein (TIGR02996 family)
MIPLPAYILAPILAEPTVDAHRLLAADWWEENGEEARAEFIRTQVQVSHYGLVRQKHRSKVPGLAQRFSQWWDTERTLLGRHAHTWLPEACRNWGWSVGVVVGASVRLTPFSGQHESGWLTFRRGFVAQVACPARLWLVAQTAAVLCATCPVEAVRFEGGAGLERGAAPASAFLLASIGLAGAIASGQLEQSIRRAAQLVWQNGAAVMDPVTGEWGKPVGRSRL